MVGIRWKLSNQNLDKCVDRRVSEDWQRVYGRQNGFINEEIKMEVYARRAEVE